MLGRISLCTFSVGAIVGAFCAGVLLNDPACQVRANEPPAVGNDDQRPLDPAGDLMLIRARNKELLDQVQNKRVSAELRDVSLDHAIIHLSEQSGIPMQLDAVALEELGVPVDEPVSAQLENVRVSSALSRLLDRRDLGWTIENESLQITSNEVIEENLQTMVIPVADIVEWFRENSRRDETRDRFGFAESIEFSSVRATSLPTEGAADEVLIDLIQQHSGGLWEELDGAGGTLSFDAGLLTVHQSLPVILQIESFLKRLRLIQKSEPSTDLWAIPEGGFGWPENRKATEALRKKISVKFVDTPLHDVVAYVGQQLGIQFEIDTQALDEIGLLDVVPINLTMSATASAVLKQVLDNLELTWLVLDDMCQVTTLDASDEYLFAIVADTRQLVAREQFSDSRLVETIQNETNGLWVEVDGTGGSIDTVGGLTFIRQTQQTIAEISVLLKDLKERAANASSPETRVDPRRMETRFYQAGSKEEAEALMTALTSFVFPDTWETDGGKGVMIEVGSKLVVRQTPEVHKAIAEFISELRAAE